MRSGRTLRKYRPEYLCRAVRVWLRDGDARPRRGGSGQKERWRGERPARQLRGEQVHRRLLGDRAARDSRWEKSKSCDFARSL